jgi:branched-chain amino acid transport system permease protein
MAFVIEVLLGGLLSGVLYALVALGFVLIYKASGVLNFAQGSMVLLAGLAFVKAQAALAAVAPFWLAALGAFLFAAAIMVAVAWATQRFVLTPLLNQSQLSLFMATIGLAFVIDSLGQLVFGSEVYALDIGLPRDPVFLLDGVFDGGLLINGLDLWGAAIAAVLVVALVLFFHRTGTGLALRAAADDHAAAQSVGIPIAWIWFVVWTIAGLVALVAALLWGSKLGIQFSIAFLALKALPVLILGGFTSIPGAIVGGLLIGAGEKLAEVFLGPMLGGGIEYWFAYVVALSFLLVRPQGLFGERIIERV